MPIGTSTILAVIAAIALTVFLYIKILPKKLDGTFAQPILQFLHDFFHFKKLYLEEVLKAIFTFATVFCVAYGALLLISYTETYSWYSGTSKSSTFATGLAVMIGGPVVLRLAYESVMMFILLVKNTMEINNKLKAPAEKTEIPPVFNPEDVM